MQTHPHNYKYNYKRKYKRKYNRTQGSITGAFSTMTPKVNPSFVLLAIQGPKVVCYVYELINGEVDVSKTEFTKNTSR